MRAEGRQGPAWQKVPVSCHFPCVKLSCPCSVLFEVPVGALGQEDRNTNTTAWTDLSILSDVLVIFYNLIKLITEQDNDGMTYKRGRLGALKAF